MDKYQSIFGIRYTEIKMESDSTIDLSSWSLSPDTITVTSAYDPNYSNTVYTTSIGTTSVDWSKVAIKHERSEIKDSGKIPVDIWARMYNNGTIE